MERNSVYLKGKIDYQIFFLFWGLFLSKPGNWKKKGLKQAHKGKKKWKYHRKWYFCFFKNVILKQINYHFSFLQLGKLNALLVRVRASAVRGLNYVRARMCTYRKTWLQKKSKKSCQILNRVIKCREEKQRSVRYMDADPYGSNNIYLSLAYTVSVARFF